MLEAPLDQFADRLVRNGEVGKFIEGLIERTDYGFIKNIVDAAFKKHGPKPPPREGGFPNHYG
jgi:hypothetical protein